VLAGLVVVLHVLAVFLLVGGIVARDTLYGRAARSDDLAAIAGLVANGALFEGLVRASSGAVLVLGLAAAAARGWPILGFLQGAPVNWVLVNGETETGVTLHYMDAKPDHGDIVSQRRVPIDRDDTALTLTRKIAAAAGDALREAYPLLVAGTAPRRPQEHRASSYFGGRKPADGEIDWRSDADSIRNLVRAVTAPWPGAFGFFRGRKLFVWRAETHALDDGSPAGEIQLSQAGTPIVATGAGALELLEVGEQGAHEAGASWARRSGIVTGERFDRR